MKYELRALDQDGRVLARSALRALPRRVVLKLLRGWAASAFDRLQPAEMVQLVCPERHAVAATVTRGTDLVHRSAARRARAAQLAGMLYTRGDLDMLAAEAVGLVAPGSGSDWMLHVSADGVQMAIAVHDTCEVRQLALGE